MPHTHENKSVRNLDCARFSALRPAKNKDRNQPARQLFVRVSDQHGYRETAPVGLSVNPSNRSNRETSVDATCKTWCEELQVGVLQDQVVIPCRYQVVDLALLPYGDTGALLHDDTLLQ